MARIVVAVQTAAGFDTKYLFPGSTPHLVDIVFQDFQDFNSDTWFVNTDIVRQGVATDVPFVVGNHFQYSISGDDIDASVVDLFGQVRRWSVTDLADPSQAQLALLTFQRDDGQDSTAIDVRSFTALSPDYLVSSLLSQEEKASLRLFGFTGDDTLRGSFWHDELNGGKGADSMIGGDGDDKYTVDNKKDKVVELKGEGKDTVVTTINYTLSSNLENLSSNGSRDLTLVGNAKANSVSGSNGDDTVKGLDGNDLLLGNLGHDVLYGGKGRDQFYFTTAPSKSNVDTIKDFSHKDDFIWIYQFAHPGLTDLLHPVSLSQLPETAFYSSKSGKAHDDNDRILYDKDDGKLYFDADGDATAHSRQLIAILTGHPTVGAENILIL